MRQLFHWLCLHEIQRLNRDGIFWVAIKSGGKSVNFDLIIPRNIFLKLLIYWVVRNGIMRAIKRDIFILMVGGNIKQQSKQDMARALHCLTSYNDGC